jgi:putative Mg2+ transporter-C (MgtC) family protein
VLGAAVGLERQLHAREAGLRTHLLVSVGAALFTIISAYGFHDVLESNSASLVRLDPSRIAAQIVTGIGFLGAGAIIRQGVSIRGLTTAATLWVVAAIGMAAGAGFYSAGVVGTALVLLALWPLRFVTREAMELVRPESSRLTVELRPGASVTPLLAQLEHVHRFEVTDTDEHRVVQLESPDVGDALVSKISDLDEVTGVRWRR